jgi:hypothetical protein
MSVGHALIRIEPPNAVTFLQCGSPRKYQQHYHDQKQCLVLGIGRAKMQPDKHNYDQVVREEFPMEWFKLAQE